MSQEAAVQEVRSTDAPELETLVNEHRILDEQVTKLDSKSFLSAEEETELHRLKKEKLLLKDQIEALRHHS